jgi:putative lipoprotein
MTRALFEAGALRWAGAVVAIVLCWAAAARPAAAQDHWWGSDKALHFGVSVGLAGGGYALAVPIARPPWARATIAASFSLMLGIAKELYDLGGAGEASWRDFTWDVIGTATGVFIALGVEWLVEALAAPSDPPLRATSRLRIPSYR